MMNTDNYTVKNECKKADTSFLIILKKALGSVGWKILSLYMWRSGTDSNIENVPK